jgi:hypothetical protein
VLIELFQHQQQQKQEHEEDVVNLLVEFVDLVSHNLLLKKSSTSKACVKQKKKGREAKGERKGAPSSFVQNASSSLLGSRETADLEQWNQIAPLPIIAYHQRAHGLTV